MANIVSVREFTKNFRNAKPGTQMVVVDACRKKILATVTFEENPETIEKNIKVIFSR